MENNKTIDQISGASSTSTACTEDGQDCFLKFGTFIEKTVEQTQSFDDESKRAMSYFLSKLQECIGQEVGKDGGMPMRGLENKLKNGLAKLQKGDENLLEKVKDDFLTQDLLWKEQYKAMAELVKPFEHKKLGNSIGPEDVKNMIENTMMRLDERIENLDPEENVQKFVETIRKESFVSVFEMISKVVPDLNK